jgi:T4 bacteriophage base plate protein
MDNNPLKQYFRRPAVFLKLPSGGKSYADGIINLPPTGELPIYPMTAIDEITARTPDALFNGTAVAELIKSCVPNIIDPWKINSNDLDAILIAIRAAAGGDSLEIESTCPKCEETSTYGVNLIGLLTTLRSGDYETPLTIGDLSFKFKPLTYEEMNNAAMDQFEIQKTYANIQNLTDEKAKEELTQSVIKKITEVTMKILSKAIEYIQTPSMRVTETEYVLDYLQNCDRNQYIQLRDYNTTLKSSTELKPLDITCVACQNKYSQNFTLNPTDFFG